MLKEKPQKKKEPTKCEFNQPAKAPESGTAREHHRVNG